MLKPDEGMQPFFIAFAHSAQDTSNEPWKGIKGKAKWWETEWCICLDFIYLFIYLFIYFFCFTVFLWFWLLPVPDERLGEPWQSASWRNVNVAGSHWRLSGREANLKHLHMDGCFCNKVTNIPNCNCRTTTFNHTEMILICYKILYTVDQGKVDFFHVVGRNKLCYFSARLCYVCGNLE